VFVPREENPILEIRSKLGELTRWSNAHSNTARTLYTVILETLNLATSKGGLSNQSWVDVEVEIDCRHALCDRARKTLFVLAKSIRGCIGVPTNHRSQVRER